MKRLAIILFSLLPLLAAAQTKVDSVTVVTKDEITGVSISDSTILFTIVGEWKKITVGGLRTHLIAGGQVTEEQLSDSIQYAVGQDSLYILPGPPDTLCTASGYCIVLPEQVDGNGLIDSLPAGNVSIYAGAHDLRITNLDTLELAANLVLISGYLNADQVRQQISDSLATVDLSTAKLDSITFNNDTLSVYEGGTQYLQDMLLDAGTIFPILIGTDSFYIDFENHRRGRYQIDLTGANEGTSIGVANPSTYGEYKFHLRNGGIKVDFPSSFLDRVGYPLDFPDGYDTTSDPIIEGYYDGTNYCFDDLVNPDTFITVWNTELTGITDTNEIILPLSASQTYNFIVDWGDGTRQTASGFDSTFMRHTYDTVGIYTVQIFGDPGWWRFSQSGDDDKIIEIQQWGGFDFKTNSTFYGCSALKITAIDTPTVSTTSLYQTFASCLSIDTLIMPGWDLSGVTSLEQFFDGASALVYAGMFLLLQQCRILFQIVPRSQK